jgi:phage FluMu protein Com
MEILFRCPTCNTITIEVKSSSCGQNIICPKCLRNGVSSVMLEHKTAEHRNMGDGFFQKVTPK